MNGLGPFALLLAAILVATFLVLVVATLVLLVRRLVTGRPVWTRARDWSLYLLIAPLLIAAGVAPYLYGASHRIDEYTTVKWVNIVATAAFVFGCALKKFWRLRRKWTFWAALSVLMVAHLVLLQRFHWTQPGYFWLVVVVGVPELTLVFFLLGLMFDPQGKLTEEKSL